jgi:glutathione-regulated potassium-efflux system ancillary protein KefG
LVELRDDIHATADGTAFHRSILVLLAHPALGRSEANKPMVAATRKLAGVSLVDLYAEYPRFDIDIDREQARLLDSDVIVFLHPLYWYSTPSLLKEWQDLVLEHGFAYGHDGTALHGKILFNALTAGGAETAYCADGYNHFTIRELLQPVEQTARLCGMQYLAPFTLFGARTAVDDGRLDSHVHDWVRVLEALRDDRLDLARAGRERRLNENLASLIRAA